MFYSKKLWLSLSLIIAVIGSVLLSQADTVRAGKDNGVFCVMDVVVESRNSTGTVIGTEQYHQEFDLEEGGIYSEDFSTRTRFKFFDASSQKTNGENQISISWFADVTVFNSVDLNTSVILGNGQKSGVSTGNNTVYTSSGSTKTIYTLNCTEN